MLTVATHSHPTFTEWYESIHPAMCHPHRVAVSLTGSGHLLVYQLGACHALMANATKKHCFVVSHVAGASGGAIAATVATQRPHALDEYARAFIEKRGGGLALLKEFLNGTKPTATTTTLGIATTRCRDGATKVWSFPPDRAELDQELLLQCVEASCQIPPSFHPWDVFSSSTSTYPEDDGIVLPDGMAYVDGGIASPAPPLILSSRNDNDTRTILVSPMAGTSKESLRISPQHNNHKNGSSLFRKFLPQIIVPHDMGMDPSWDNLRALRASAGLVSSSELSDWYEQGQVDAAAAACTTFCTDGITV